MTTEHPGDDTDRSDRTTVQNEFSDIDRLAHEVAQAVAQSRGDDPLAMDPLEYDLDLEAIRKALLSDAPMLIQAEVQDTTVLINENAVVAAPTEDTALAKRR